jgi:alanine racemase
MSHSPTVLEISLSAVEHNFNYFKSIISGDTKMLAVVKASGYGSDSFAVAKLLEENGIDYFAVAYADEGIALRNEGVSAPILVLHPQFRNLELMSCYSLEPNLYSEKLLREFVRISKLQGLDSYPVHLKFNTGLNRLGFRAKSLAKVYSILRKEKSLRVKSIFSHMVASEDEDSREFSLKQINEFDAIVREFENLWGYRPIRHMTNTSGVLNYPQAHFDMVRVGLGLYGFANDASQDSKLLNVLTLKSVISQIHEVQAGETVGYNMGFTADAPLRTSTIPIGHADGIFRSLGQGKISVKINGKEAPVIGNICMDMIMADVTGIDCKEGDDVILFDCREDISRMAHQAHTISYEILTALGPRIRRKII